MPPSPLYLVGESLGRVLVMIIRFDRFQTMVGSLQISHRLENRFPILELSTPTTSHPLSAQTTHSSFYRKVAEGGKPVLWHLLHR